MKFTNNGENWIVTGGFRTDNLNEFYFAWIDTDKEEMIYLRNFREFSGTTSLANYQSIQEMAYGVARDGTPMIFGVT